MSQQTEPPHPMPVDQAREWIKSFDFWYQRHYLGNGVYTLSPAFHELVWAEFEKALPPRLTGASVLDVGCNAGYFALQAKLRGAGLVVGTEVVPWFLDQAEGVRKVWGVDIDYRLMDAHNIASLEQSFAIAVFAGILYHLKNPLQVIDTLGQICTDAILLETEFIPYDSRNCLVVRNGYPAALEPISKGFMRFIEGNEVNRDSSNWWIPDEECVRGMLRTAGFAHISRPVVLNGTRLLLVASKRQDSLLQIDAFGA